MEYITTKNVYGETRINLGSFIEHTDKRKVTYIYNRNDDGTFQKLGSGTGPNQAPVAIGSPLSAATMQQVINDNAELFYLLVNGHKGIEKSLPLRRMIGKAKLLDNQVSNKFTAPVSSRDGIVNQVNNVFESPSINELKEGTRKRNAKIEEMLRHAAANAPSSSSSSSSDDDDDDDDGGGGDDGDGDGGGGDVEMNLSATDVTGTGKRNRSETELTDAETTNQDKRIKRSTQTEEESSNQTEEEMEVQLQENNGEPEPSQRGIKRNRVSVDKNPKSGKVMVMDSTNIGRTNPEKPKKLVNEGLGVEGEIPVAEKSKTSTAVDAGTNTDTPIDPKSNSTGVQTETPPSREAAVQAGDGVAIVSRDSAVKQLTEGVKTLQEKIEVMQKQKMMTMEENIAYGKTLNELMQSLNEQSERNRALEEKNKALQITQQQMAKHQEEQVSGNAKLSMGHSIGTQTGFQAQTSSSGTQTTSTATATGGTQTTATPTATGETQTTPIPTTSSGGTQTDGPPLEEQQFDPETDANHETANEGVSANADEALTDYNSARSRTLTESTFPSSGSSSSSSNSSSSSSSVSPDSSSSSDASSSSSSSSSGSSSSSSNSSSSSSSVSPDTSSSSDASSSSPSLSSSSSPSVDASSSSPSSSSLSSDTSGYMMPNELSFDTIMMIRDRESRQHGDQVPDFLSTFETTSQMEASEGRLYQISRIYDDLSSLGDAMPNTPIDPTQIEQWKRQSLVNFQQFKTYIRSQKVAFLEATSSATFKRPDSQIKAAFDHVGESAIDDRKTFMLYLWWAFHNIQDPPIHIQRMFEWNYAWFQTDELNIPLTRHDLSYIVTGDQNLIIPISVLFDIDDLSNPPDEDEEAADFVAKLARKIANESTAPPERS
jgi:hypothetical protein